MLSSWITPEIGSLSSYDGDKFTPQEVPKCYIGQIGVF